MSAPPKVDTRVTVETPEGVDFQFVIAGPGKRGYSFALDMLIKVGAVAIVAILVSLVSELQDRISGVGAGVLLLVWFAMSWLYGSCCEAFLNGQTFGKRAYHLRVVRTNGTPIGWFEAFGRNLLLPADSMLVLGPIAFNTVGLISMIATPRMQRLGDLVFDTMVIDESRDYISRSPEVTMGVERLKRSQCSGRFHVPERTLAVIERLFEGDRLISDGRREEIARPVAEAIRQRLGFDEGGPDPTNPNAYFAQQGHKHATFLRRVLKTFADDEAGVSDESAETDSRRSSSYMSSSSSSSNKELWPDPSGPQAFEAATAVKEPNTDQSLEELTVDDVTVEESDVAVEPTGLPRDWRSE